MLGFTRKPRRIPASVTRDVVLHLFDGRRIVLGHRGQALRILFQRMAGHVEPQNFLFRGQPLRLGPFGHIGHLERRRRRSVRACP